MAELTILQYINGIFAIGIIVFYVFIGLKIISQYKRNKNKTLLHFGIIVPLLSAPWWPISYAFICVLLTSRGISYVLYFILGYGVSSIGLFFWLIIFTDLVYKEKQKLIISLFAIYAVIYDTIIYFFLFTNPSLVIVLSGPIQSTMGPLLLIRSIIVLIILLLTSIIIYRISHNSDNPEVRLKGKLILVGMILFLTGGLIFAITKISLFPLIFFIPSVFGIYGGLLLPDWMKKLFLKEK